jgi:hypothetical protein
MIIYSLTIITVLIAAFFLFFEKEPEGQVSNGGSKKGVNNYFLGHLF